ncbi:GGDEF domain-containing protein [Janthinobacterium lividum]|uniref:diguanylate cyclase n=1 Tax=Janthinobacterium lividum TaxID=29581 RepID=A0ABU0XXD2_9BURK|nr:GGDEF domain-containing protein [Janthinobacterium lividum]MDQ4627595.1 GGDEF domain-containing protein [Janthinobacterium lividum]MDQ4675823.1 GGDEF domain-containing protein [Janthinobacterium lividum]MDQ4686553.1 GGDEF domain-containing protein [Janthinobacterium lividum]
MQTLDPRTIMLMTTLMCGAMSIVMFSVYRSFRREVHGLGHWAAGLLLLVCASLLFGTREVLPPALSVIAANAALVAGIGLSMLGTETFFGVAPSRRAYLLILALAITGNSWWLLVHPDFSARVAVFSLLVFLFYARQAQLVWRHGERHFSSFFFGALMLTQAIVVLARGVSALPHGGASVNLTVAGTPAGIYLAVANFMALLLTVCFMTVATRRLQQILERRSTHDPLTQVLNRRGFGDVYAREMGNLRRRRLPLTLLSIDLDYFKSINDRYGHAVGDQVLAHVATVIGGALRESDCVARYGGEEFVVLMPDMPVQSALGVAERIRTLLRESSHAGLPSCTVSIGVACQASVVEGLEQLLSRADAALYLAKERGRDRIELDTAALTVDRTMSAAGIGTGR